MIKLKKRDLTTCRVKNTLFYNSTNSLFARFAVSRGREKERKRGKEREREESPSLLILFRISKLRVFFPYDKPRGCNILIRLDILSTCFDTFDN